MKIEDLAQELYNRDCISEVYAEVFTMGELIELWKVHCVYSPTNTYGADYDDEVYDALADKYNYFKEEK